MNKEEHMSSTRPLGVGYLLIGVLAAGTSTASAKNSRQLDILYPAVLKGTTLEGGNYQITWVAHSPQATVTFKQGKHVVATVEGKLEERDRKFEHNAVIYNTDSQGKRTISEIRLGGTNQAIVFRD
jgi:hypothetical protein